MEQIVVYKRDGTKRCDLNSYAKLCTVKSAEQKCELLGEDTVTIKTESVEPLDFSIGDYIIVYSKVYTLNKLSEPKKSEERKFENTLIFEGLQYKMLDAQFRSADASGYNPTSEFPLVADIKTVMQILVRCVNRTAASIGEAWILGDCIETEHKELSFNNENCLSVLQRICSEFETEFEIEPLVNRVYKLHIRKAGSTFGDVFTYGKGGGIYTLTRKNVSSTSIVTKLYVEGGSKNIKTGYRNNATRLRLATNEESYIQQNEAVAAMGIKEGGKIFDDIYPHRTGEVTAFGADVYTFVDDKMFDLNEKDAEGSTKWLIDGTTAKVKFVTGCVAGYELELSSYDSKTHTFRVKEYVDSRGLKIPNKDTNAYQISVGDKYVLLDIIMPDDYVIEAENKLLEEGTKYYEQNCQPKVQYELEIASMYLKRKYGDAGIVEIFKVGDYIQVKDDDIKVDKAIRIKGFTRNISTEPYKYKLTISDTVDISIIEKLIADNLIIDKIIILNNLTDVAKARRNWRTTQELLSMIFDSDGYFDTENIKPNSIETLMLSVGNRAGQFIMRDVTLVANSIVKSKPAPNMVQVISNEGLLIHYAIADTDKTWIVSSSTIELKSTASHYIYARCSKDNNGCNIVCSTDKKGVDDDTNYYYFPVGLISAVYEGYREITTTYGATRITGRTISCGRIESIDKKTYFDIDNGKIGGNISIEAGSSGLENLAEWAQAASDIENAKNAAGEAHNAVSALNDYIDGAFADGIITEAEAKAIEKYINTINSDKATIEATYKKLYANTYLSGTPKTDLLNAKVTLMGSIESLIKSINTAIADGQTTVAEKKDVDDKYAAFNSAYAGFNTAVEAANKAIQDTLKSYSDGALKEAQQALKDAADAADAANKANDSVGDLSNYVDGAFADGIITEAEAKAIEKYINTVNNTKAAVEATYTKLYTNTYLSGTPKTDLLNAKVSLFGAITNLITAINTAIADGKTTTTEKKNVDAKFTLFNSALATFNTAVESANKAIQDALKKFSDENKANLTILSNKIEAQVTRIDNIDNVIEKGGWLTTAEGNALYASKTLENGENLISYINQSAGNTTIKSSKIDIIGAVTFSTLNSDLQALINGKADSSILGALATKDSIEAAQLGSTIIVGGYLNTDLIKVRRIDANSGFIGGFTLDNGTLYWKGYDYFGGDSRSVRLGVPTNSKSGMIDVSFNGATEGRFGVKVVGSNSGGACVYASRYSTESERSYPNNRNTYAGFFDGGVFVKGSLLCDTFLANEFGTSWSINSDGSYSYRKGVTQNISQQYGPTWHFVNGLFMGF
ncbi:phage tail protein [Bacteroides xylanisolvens]|uniref:phage tail protein n=1 Tax=Bacteroides xylanisolvens TaxID=371601 RepID=UPI001D05CB46|nr:phage tail protein [Bacteroides xylanisolvens]MCB6712268.1 phage tail protein [Bacteroides xylanisolvens]MCB6732324.1 phage tail protein [Bacteroides xylanisolvens]MCB7119715.1 phage tail protein [Bacteroides xylanisolvens]